MEVGSLTAVGVVRLHRLGGFRIVNNRIDSVPDLLHDLVAGLQFGVDHFFNRQPFAGVEQPAFWLFFFAG